MSVFCLCKVIKLRTLDVFTFWMHFIVQGKVLKFYHGNLSKTLHIRVLSSLNSSLVFHCVAPP